MAKVQVKSQHNARLRTQPDLNNADNILSTIGPSVIIENVTLTEDGQWYELPNTYVHVSTVNLLVADNTDPSSPSNGTSENRDPIKVPYRSQWDADANNRTADCGQTCVAMLSQWMGVNTRINDLRFQSQPTGLSSGQDLVNNFNALGLKANFKTVEPVSAVSQTMLPDELLKDLPAICLVSYAGFDRLSVQDKKYTGWHWLVLLEYDDIAKQVVTNDPDFWPARREEGHKKRYTYSEWAKAFIPYSNGKLQYVTLA